VTDYVKAVESGGNTTLSVDFDGAGTTYNFVDVAVLNGVTVGDTITFVYDDASSTTTITVT
ncbi:MAG: hypothetical protein R3D43_06790, partial [Tepidamorphaceae bacterium]